MTPPIILRIGLGIGLALGSAGQQQSATITGLVFLDANGNGRRDQGERGIPNVVVSNQIDVARTDGSGAYRIAPGRGTIFVSVPDGYRAVGSFWHRESDPAGDFALTPSPRVTSFTFIHGSDTHIAPAVVPRMARFRAIVDSVKPDFTLVTGDLVRDALRVSEAEATGYYELFQKEIAGFRGPVWTVPGNHENFGIERHLSLVSSAHPLYGKGMYRQRLGPNYYSFSYGGVHFVGLDSVDIADLWYYGHIDDRQLAWLRADLEAVAADVPVVTFNHIPFVSAVDMIGGYQDDGPAPTLIKLGDRTVFRHVVSNFKDVAAVLQARDWPLALGGHFHTRESIRYESPVRTRFEQAAAVVGPTTNVVPAISGVTLYRVKNRVIDGGEFIRLQ